MKTRLVVPAIAFGAFVLAACGGGSDGGADATVPTDADLVVTAVDPLAWDKAEYTVAAGDDVIAVSNNSSQPHNLHIVGPDKTELPVALDIPSKGDVKSATVTLAPGAYSLICTIPGHNSMKATLTVT